MSRHCGRYEEEHKHLNFEESKEEFQKWNLNEMRQAASKPTFFRLIFAATATVADSTDRIFHLGNINSIK